MSDPRVATASFEVAFEDSAMGIRKTFVLSVWDEIPGSPPTMQIYDKHSNRMFLKRTVPPERPKLSDIYIGARIVLCARTFDVVDFADERTRRRFAAVRGRAALVVKPDAYHSAGKIIDLVYRAKLNVGQLRLVKFSEAEAAEFLEIAAGSSAGVDPSAVSHMASDACWAMEVTGDDVMMRLHELVGPADPRDAKELVPVSIRAIFGSPGDRVRNAVYVSRDIETAQNELQWLFGRRYPHPGIYTHCSVCLIKPHAVADKAAGKIIDMILGAGTGSSSEEASDFSGHFDRTGGAGGSSKFGRMEVSAARSIVLSAEDAKDYLEPYRTVCPEYERWVVELSSGPAIILEVRGEDVVPGLRELAGPYDPEIARALRPSTIRARFGVNSVKNAVHVTDVTVDGPLESKFFFVVLNNE